MTPKTLARLRWGAAANYGYYECVINNQGGLTHENHAATRLARAARQQGIDFLRDFVAQYEAA